MIHVFADASSLILLEKAGLLSLMLSRYILVIPPSVFKEITAANTPDASVFSVQVALKQLHVMALPENRPDKESHSGLKKLDPGERDTISLYLSKEQGFILTDDGKAARWCHNGNLPFINALLVPKIFQYAGLINKERSLKAMNRLCELGWYADTIKAFAFDCTKEQLKPFLPG